MVNPITGTQGPSNDEEEEEEDDALLNWKVTT